MVKVDINPILTMNKNKYCIFDFETSGLSPDSCRVIEVGAVIIEDNQIIDEFSELMNPGHRIPYEISKLTGITNLMLKGKPKPEKIITKFHKFIGDLPLVAHNVSFDSKFLQAELKRINISSLPNPCICTLLLARRLILSSPNFQLGTLINYLKMDLADDHQKHRALDDVLATVQLWTYLEKELKEKTGLDDIPVELYLRVMKKSKKNVPNLLDKIYAGEVKI